MSQQKPLHEDSISTNAGRDLFMSSLRKVLERHGYHGKQLEVKINQLMQKDVSRLAAIIARPRQPKR